MVKNKVTKKKRLKTESNYSSKVQKNGRKATWKSRQ